MKAIIIAIAATILAGCANAPHWCGRDEYPGATGCKVHYTDKRSRTICDSTRVPYTDRWGRTTCIDQRGLDRVSGQ